MTRDPLAEVVAGESLGDSSTWEYGVVVDVDGMATVTVSIGGVSTVLPFDNSYAPRVGDAVIVLQRGTRRVVIGATIQPTPMAGTVTAFTAFTCTVTVNGIGGYVLRYLASYAPTNGDSVWVINGGVVGKFAAAPPAPPPAAPGPPPPPPAATGQSTFAARDAATWRSGWRTDTSGVFQGSTSSGANSGAFFYGTVFQDALAGASVSAARIWLHRRIGSGVYGAEPVHLYLHTDGYRPAGDVSRPFGPRDRNLAVEEAGWFDLGADWAASLISGTTRGVGITGAPYLKLASLAEDGMSGAIQIDWSR